MEVIQKSTMNSRFRFTCPVCKKEVSVQFMNMERYMVMESGLEIKY